MLKIEQIKQFLYCAIVIALGCGDTLAATPLINCNTSNHALQSTANPPSYGCTIFPSGTVTTTGTPAMGNLTQFSGSSSITNGNLSGDVTTTNTLAVTLATVNTNTGAFGSSMAIPYFTVNGKGLISAAGTNAVIAPAGTLSGATLAAGVTGSSLTSVGTIGSGVWQGTDVAVLYGGTGAATASGARTNLGLAIGTNVEAWSSILDAVAAGTYTGASSITTLGTITTGTWHGTAIGNSYLANSATTVNGQSCVLGSSCSITAPASGITVGTTTISGGTSGDIEYNNGGMFGEKGVTGTGSVCLATSPTVSGLTVTGSLTATGLVTNADLANSTISGIALGNNLGMLTFGTHLISGGSSYNGSAGVTITSDATNANTASTIVARDGSGNFTAGTITANLTGTASAAPLSGITGLGTGVATALGDNVGSAGAFVVNGGALGTPSSGTATNLTGTAASLTAGTVTTNANLTGGVTSVGNAATVVTNANLTGPVTSSGNATTITNNAVTTSTINANAVTYAKLQSETASTLLGNPTESGAVPSEITLGTNLSFSGSVLNASSSASTNFSALAAGTNSTAAMVVGTGASLASSGSGTIAATSVPASGITGSTLASGVTGSSLTSTGTLTGGATGSGFTVALGSSTVTGQAVVANGGTGDASLTAYAPLFGGTTSTGAVQSGTVGLAGQVLTSNGAGALPTMQTVQTVYPSSSSNICSSGSPHADLLAQTAAVTNIINCTTVNDSTVHTYFLVDYANITANVTDTLGYTITFQDENNVTQTIISITGLAGAGVTGYKTNSVSPLGLVIRAYPNTAITYSTTQSITSGSITYDIGISLARQY